MDAIFTPIKKVNYVVENMRVGKRTDFDKLSLEVETDGTITPEEALSQSLDILVSQFQYILENIAVAEKKETKKKK
jgi:DNA-directed RNA polymerase subunit alpha